MSRPIYDELVLAIFPTSRGIAYTLFAAPLTPIDWGLKRALGRNKNVRSLEIVKQLCKSLRPDTLIIEDCVTAPCRRSRRVRQFYALVQAFAQAENLILVRYSRSAIKRTFQEAGAVNRHQIAQAIVSYIPAFAHRRPSPRKIWQSEDHRLGLFDAAALALTHYAFIPEHDDKPP